VATWLREESDPSLGGVDIITDRLCFAAQVTPVIAKLRDQFIGLTTQLNELERRARQAHERAHPRPNADEPAPKRAANAASGSMAASTPAAFRVMKGWDSARQMAASTSSDPNTYISVDKDEVVKGAVHEADPEWFEVQRSNGESGLAPTKFKGDQARFEEIQQPAKTSLPPPVESDDSGGEEEQPEAQPQQQQQSPLENGATDLQPSANDASPAQSPNGSNMASDQVIDLAPTELSAASAPAVPPVNTPIGIDDAHLGSWHPHHDQHGQDYKYNVLTGGPHSGKTLWWDGSGCQLADGDEFKSAFVMTLEEVDA